MPIIGSWLICEIVLYPRKMNRLRLQLQYIHLNVFISSTVSSPISFTAFRAARQVTTTATLRSSNQRRRNPSHVRLHQPRLLLHAQSSSSTAMQKDVPCGAVYPWDVGTPTGTVHSHKTFSGEGFLMVFLWCYCDFFIDLMCRND